MLISFPARTIVDNCPIGIKSNKVPNSASLIESTSLIIGILLAHEEKTSPWAQKSKKQELDSFELFKLEDSVWVIIKMLDQNIYAGWKFTVAKLGTPF